MSAMLSASSNNGSKKQPATKSNPFGIKMHSKTVVMKKDYVTTGVLAYVEGDIIEVETYDLKSFELGDQVKVTIYSSGGIHVFESHVVAKDRDSLIILNPPQNDNKFAERREHPRLQVFEEGKAYAIIDATKRREQLEEPLHLTVNNVSISGIGFTLLDNIELTSLMQLELEVNIGSAMNVTAEIVRREKAEFGYFYGAQFVDLAADKLTSLRAYILMHQVESHYRKKEEEKYNEAHGNNG
ncbi:hypothetical protein SD70_28170 [Gordoniibacillus kamchatkensis]|uniref:PilZ domain-containing protein n=1 Tax=Gordoniibacillus kamchatkensis TaxID=1590651 RepID=A0ABR5AAR9_9BACL|nr:PilZ domain-containing protein [Paenibacillus sp. VKM B-2647]KIL38156.1 hypothetical protein SD70_28170 [Paenibacillus sp. VKM B-2647]